MIEIMWRLEHDIIAQEEVLRPLLEAICGVPGFVAASYDVNGREQWRGFDRIHALVDGLTQRTQWLRISGADGQSMAMIALGKHGEVPTMLMNLASFGVGRMDELTLGWEELFETVGVGFAAIYSEPWRRALAAAGVEPVWGMVQAWGESALPETFGEMLDVVDGCGAMRRYRRGELDVLVVGGQELVEDGEHALALGRLQDLID